ncbi:MAG: murE/murF fusion protein [Desulforhopalus sp.]|jgi:murE/murF fusion protein
MTVIKDTISVTALLSGVPCLEMMNSEQYDLSALTVSQVTADSRQVGVGALFVALPGVGVDGHDFVEDAISCGAQVIVGLPGRLKKNATDSLGVIFIEVADTYKAYADISANYFGNPAEDLVLVAVTGTNGKTTVTYIVEDILKEAGVSVGVVGTVNNRYTTRDGKTTFLPTRFTTPEAFSLQQVLKEMSDHDIEIVIMEVSSHALAQFRIGSVSFKAAAFTNLSRDHLDYHQGMDDYFQAKMRLFADHLQKGGTAVLPQINAENEVGNRIEQIYSHCTSSDISLINWGVSDGVDIKLLSHKSSLAKTTMELMFQGSQLNLNTLLVGYYNIENILAAMGLCLALGVKRKHILSGVSKTTGAPGRLQRIVTEQWGDSGPTVFVDYAHTPDALEKVLSTAKELPHNELYGVFGCGGDRDNGKRALMGGIGARLCDVSIVTDDNPRTEDPDFIVSQVVEGVVAADCCIYPLEWLRSRKSKESGCVVVRDRHEAIQTAIKTAKAGDIVVISGKGHEPYQITIKGKKYFDDRMQAKEVLLSWTVALVAEAAGGECQSGADDCLLGPVTTDSRLKTDKGVFVALKGENHDAHKYAAQAVENGAKCLIVDHLVLDGNSDVAQVVVSDTLKALGDLAAYRRQKLACECKQRVIGLTGSCGKTTVKEMIAAILKRKYPEGEDYPGNAVLKTEGNFNNLIGLPLSLLPLGVHNRVAVLEMGMNIPGEIQRLTEIADPDISCITNIYGAHLLGLYSIEGVADAKEELFQNTKKSGLLIVNLDDERIAARSKKYEQQKITFGVNCVSEGVTPDLWASDINLLEGGTITFTMHCKGEKKEIHLYIAGEHNVTNALCAAATTMAAGCTVDEIVLGLADFRAPDKRLELIASGYGFEILNDTYNANPASMAAGLKALANIGRGKKIAVLGDMLELGGDAKKAHYEIGNCAVEQGVDFLVSFGEWAAEIQSGWLENGGDVQKFKIFENKDQIVNLLKDQVSQGSLGVGDLVLFKASRGLRFETMVEALK